MKNVAIAPLFDQLTENSNFSDSQSNTKILLDKKQLLESIQIELTRIFETRSSFSFDDSLFDDFPNESYLSVIPGFMGMPSLSNIFIEDSGSWFEFERNCERIIRLFEPRLLEPIVKVESFDKKIQTLNILIEGSIKFGSLRENVSFPINFSDK